MSGPDGRIATVRIADDLGAVRRRKYWVDNDAERHMGCPDVLRDSDRVRLGGQGGAEKEIQQTNRTNTKSPNDHNDPPQMSFEPDWGIQSTQDFGLPFFQPRPPQCKVTPRELQPIHTPTNINS